MIEQKIISFATSNETALIIDGSEIKYFELLENSYAIWNEIKNTGLRSGDKIIVSMKNSPEFIYCYFAALIGGVTIVPLDPSMGDENYKYIKSLIKPKLIINDKYRFKYNRKSTNYHESPNVITIETTPSDIYAIFFTSGSTGRPKGVCHSLSSLFGNAMAFNKHVGITKRAKMLHVMPMGYMAGFLNTVLVPLMAGGVVVIAPKFSVSNVFNIWNIARDSGANAAWFSPTMLALLLKMSRDQETVQWVADHMEKIFVGTAPLSTALRNSFYDKFAVHCLESYGMTESLIISSEIDSSGSIEPSVGTALPGVQLRLKKNDINSKQIIVKSAFMFSAYYEGLGNVCYSQQWVSTGDLGLLDKKNGLVVTGRIKDLIIHGGVNVSPTKVQETISEIIGVEEVVVAGKPHEFWGEEVIAFVKMAENKYFDKKNAFEYCREKLNPDAVPSRFVEVNDFPKTVTGKYIKHKLIEYL
jgi:acyl-CoA synthetase (AMP-forming)/AMP-acid ligase II